MADIKISSLERYSNCECDIMLEGAGMKQLLKKNTADALFASFMFFQFSLLGLGNHAGEGWLSNEKRELVYYGLQVLVIIGLLGYAAAEHFLQGERIRKNAGRVILALLFICSAVMCFAEKGSLFYLVVTFAAMPGLGYLGGTVYRCMSRETAAGAKTARSMGIGCAVATALQFLLQIQWGETPLLPVFVLAALVLTAFLTKGDPQKEKQGSVEETTPRALLFACLTTAAFLLFTGFYNGYIHHLQIQSDYTEYNVYSLPRLMLIPCYLLFAWLGDKRQGRLVPVLSLCIALTAMLNSVLTASASAYRLNMCLFYCAVAAAVAYYDLTFWRLAEGTKHPALWAPMGRVLDSAMVLVTTGVKLSNYSAPVVLALNLAGLAAIIVLMTVNGTFNLNAVTEQISAPEGSSPEYTFEQIRKKYVLTPRETDVLKELVLTEDKQTVISERLSITVKSLQRYVTSLYKKTGTETRSGLTDLYHKTMNGQ